MTVREEVRQRIEQDSELIRLRKKIESGKGTYADTAAYSIRAGKLLGEIFSRRLPEIPLEEREPICVDLLHDQYIDINLAVDTVQRFRDEAQGFHLAPQHAPFDAERGHQIGSSLRDLSKPVETLQRRAQSAPETATKSMHDDRMKAESKFRHRAGLDCRITRVAVNGCCPWCSKVAGRYAYGEEPDDIYRRHDNCDCTVTFENGRKRQDVWSKREWEVPGKDAGAGKPTVFSAEQVKNAGAEPLFYMSNSFRPTYEQKQTSFSLGDKRIIGFRVQNSEFELYSDTPMRKNKAVRFVEKALKTVKPNLPQGFGIPPVVVVDFEKYGLNIDRQGNVHDVIGGFASESGILFINSRYNTPKKILAFVTKYKGQFANQTEYAPILHELGHKYYEDSVKRLAKTNNISYNEAKNIIDSKIYDYISTRNPDGRFVRNNISGYAATGYDCHSYTEIIAECFSAANGNTIAGELLNLLTG